jgi:hypothetical protein
MGGKMAVGAEGTFHGRLVEFACAAARSFILSQHLHELLFSLIFSTKDIYF